MIYNLSEVALIKDQQSNRILSGKIMPSWETLWAHKGHRVGQCYVRDRIAYLNIPKCASSFLKNALGWNHRCFDNMVQSIDVPVYYTSVDHIMVVMTVVIIL